MNKTFIIHSVFFFRDGFVYIKGIMPVILGYSFYDISSYVMAGLKINARSPGQDLWQISLLCYVFPCPKIMFSLYSSSQEREGLSSIIIYYHLLSVTLRTVTFSRAHLNENRVPNALFLCSR